MTIFNNIFILVVENSNNKRCIVKCGDPECGGEVDLEKTVVLPKELGRPDLGFACGKCGKLYRREGSGTYTAVLDAQSRELFFKEGEVGYIAFGCVWTPLG